MESLVQMWPDVAYPLVGSVVILLKKLGHQDMFELSISCQTCMRS